MALNRVGNNTTGGALTSFAINANNRVLQNTEDLVNVIGNSNMAASRRRLQESLGLGDYSESAQLYREKAVSAAKKIGLFPGFEESKGDSLDVFKKNQKAMAGYRPNDFSRQYSLSLINSNLAHFQKTQSSYWQEQQTFIGINSDVLLTKELESHYKTLIEMENGYKFLVESGRQIESFNVLGQISGVKQQIDALKAQLVSELT
jgi:hypothetical protein